MTAGSWDLDEQPSSPLPRKESYSVSCMNPEVSVMMEPSEEYAHRTFSVLRPCCCRRQSDSAKNMTKESPRRFKMYIISNEWMGKRMIVKLVVQAGPGHFAPQRDHLGHQTWIGLPCHWPLSPGKRTSHQHRCPWAESGLAPTPATEPLVFRPADPFLEAVRGPT